MVDRKIKLIQPGRIGDIIICFPIAKFYSDIGYKVYWPVHRRFIPLFNYVNYAEAISIKWWPVYLSAFPAYFSTPSIKDKLDILIGFWGCNKMNTNDWLKSNLSFDKWKYKKAKVPFEEKYKLKINRNFKKEARLKEIIGAKGRYVVTHSVGNNYKYDFKKNSIEVVNVKGFNIFDWIGIFEDAEEIYCIDSSVANLVNGLGIAKNRRYFRPLYGYHSADDIKRLTPVMADDWKIIRE